ncbi:GGDEF domain-containing protein [Clostridium sp. AF15-17LB]|nr:GGDEF domain-containing protein [Clostridium sp. AF15-17LB]
MQMKKLSLLKMVQLTVLVILTLVSICLLLNSDIKQYIFSNMAATILFAVVWIIIIASFIFLLMDFNVISEMKLNYHNLYQVAYSDPLSGIPNRFSCDVLIEKYIDQDLPDSVGCAVLDLTNLPEINSKYNHATGNKLLSEFSTLLSSAAANHGFVGRNGGNKFLAIFEDCDRAKLNNFLESVERKVERHNASSKSLPIEYKAGFALNSEEEFLQITRLIALANQRVYE